MTNISNNSKECSDRSAQRPETRNAVCLCTDRRMMIPALFVADAVKSRAAHAENRFDIIIFAEPSEVTDAHRQWMRERDIQLCDDMDMSYLRGVGQFQERLSPATLMKLLLAEHLAGRYEQILYLDCDLTIHDDISSLFFLKPAPFALAAVPSGRVLINLSEKKRNDIEDHFQKLGMTKPYRFFNTGLLYIDVELWNREKLGERALDFIRKNPDLCSLPDEHALNGILDGNIAQLSPIWNTHHSTKRWRHGKASGCPVIVHHTGHNKPWRRFCYGKGVFPDLSYYELYKDFLKDSPWPDWLNEQWGWHDLYLNIRGEIGRVLRNLGLRGEPDKPSRKQHKAYMEAVRRFNEDEIFIDVEQGIVVREKGKFLLNQRRPAKR